jgi:hypothetical protein
MITDNYFIRIKNKEVNLKLLNYIENLNTSIEHPCDLARFFEFVRVSYTHEIIDSDILFEALKFYGINNLKHIESLVRRYELLICFMKYNQDRTTENIA